MTEHPQKQPYDVHLFCLLRLSVPNVQATSYQEAAEQAGWQLGAEDLHEQLAEGELNLADECSHVIVQCSGKGGEDARTFHPADHPFLTPLRRLVAWYDAKQASDDELAQIIVSARELLANTI